MVYCSNCGEKNRDGSKFCSNCGEPLKSAVIPRKKSRAAPSKPLQSKYKSSQNSTRNGLDQTKQQYREQSHREQPYMGQQEYRSQAKEEVQEKNFEWNVIVVGALILVIIAGILSRILPGIAAWVGAAIAIIYALSATKRKSTIFLVIPLILVMAAVISSFFSL